jgi:hypothetical protein
LLGNAFEGAWREIVAWLSSNRNAPRPLGMLELPVTPSGGDKRPAAQLQLSDDLADLHTTRIAGLNAQCRLLLMSLASVELRNLEQGGMA